MSTRKPFRLVPLSTTLSIPHVAMRVLIVMTILLSLPVAFAAETTLIAESSIWKYLDDGSIQGKGWIAPGFDDSGWRSGPGELGYGDGDEATLVSDGGDPDNRWITTWFRRELTIADPSAVASLLLRVVHDDGVVVYLNGVEVWRDNMPAGEITPATPASYVVSGADESGWVETQIDPMALVPGVNTIAVEVHQSGGTSSDLSFALELIAGDQSSPRVTRGPYLQQADSSEIVLRWRTSVPTDSLVLIGLDPSRLDRSVGDSTVTTDHSIRVSGLSPFTRYYYSVGMSSAMLSGGDRFHSFRTSPQTGEEVPTRIWVVGDPGTAKNGAKAVRDAYTRYSAGRPTDVWLTLGDNAYESGTDTQYQYALFDLFREMLRRTPLWPAIGNHDTAQSSDPAETLPYYQIFTLPSQGEAGGVASGTEDYYSFDYANIHFISLDSMTSDRSSHGPMLTWLKADLAATQQPWIIAYWHHPPYSKGSHDSDSSPILVEMRENALPVLEDFGVDLVLTAHSHSYERSYLVDRHYGTSATFAASMLIDGGDGRPWGSGAYWKPWGAAHAGAVYAVSGSSAITAGGDLNHPAMFRSLNSLGSLALDVRGNRLEGTFLTDAGTVADSFTIVKGIRPPRPAPPASLQASIAARTVRLVWTDTSSDEDGFRIDRCTGAGCQSFVPIARVSGRTTFRDTKAIPGTLYRYRVASYNDAGPSEPTGIVQATTVSTLRRRAVR